MPVSLSRAAAFEILLAVDQKQAHADDLLHSSRYDRLSTADHGLCTTIVLGVLRWQLLLDHDIAAQLTHRGALAAPTQIALRMGLFQLRHLDRIPAHAALFESVELVKGSDAPHTAGLVNAVLRKLAAKNTEAQASQATASQARDILREDQSDHAANQAAEIAHPQWLLERWRKSFDPETISNICRADQQQPPTCFRMPDMQPLANFGPRNSHGVDASFAAEALLPGKLLARARLLDPVRDPPAVRSPRDQNSGVQNLRIGNLRIQDEGSQLIAELAASLVPTPRRILDCCAAPGGKTAMLSELHPDAHIVACDVSTARLKTMQRLLQGVVPSERISYRLADAAKLTPETFPRVFDSGPDPNPDPGFDLILCDVPCSGTGTLARNPEIRHRLQPADFERFHQKQLGILNAALRLLAPGRRLLYSTCSLEPEENQAVVNAVLDQQSVYLEPISPAIQHLGDNGNLAPGGMECLRTAIDGDFLRTLPGKHPCDGFFAAIFRSPA